MFRFIITLAFIHIFVFSYSQPQTPNQIKAKQILQKSVSKNKNYKSYKADFKYTVENKMDSTRETENGTFWQKEGKFKVSLTNQVIFCDTRTVWIYLKKENEVQVNNYTPGELEINPKEMFTMWEKGFLYGYAGQVQLNGKFADLIELTPNDKSKDYFKVKLFIDKTTNSIVKIQTFYKNSNIVTLDILSFTPNVPMTDNFFVFDMKSYPRVKIVDLRN